MSESKANEQAKGGAEKNGGREIVLDLVNVHKIDEVRRAGASHGHNRSFMFWLEECLDAGRKAKLRSWEYSDVAKGNKAFKDACISLDPESKDFPAEFASLRKKFGIGGTKVSL